MSLGSASESASWAKALSVFGLNNREYYKVVFSQDDKEKGLAFLLTDIDLHINNNSLLKAIMNYFHIFITFHFLDFIFLIT